MVQRRWWAIAAFVAVFGMTSSARAESRSVATIRDGVEDLDARTKVIRPLIERASPQARYASERMMSVIERDRASLLTRLAIIDILGGAFDDNGPAMHEMVQTMKGAARALSIVETWYGLR
jgi:hypothetical protein